MPQLLSQYARRQNESFRRAYRLHIAQCKRDNIAPMSRDAFMCARLLTQLQEDFAAA